MEHIKYIEDGILNDYYRLEIEELTKKLTIDNNQFTPFSFQRIEKRKLKNFSNGQMKKFDYVQLHCGFDIETTTVFQHYDENRKRDVYNSFMYIWQFGFISHGYQFVVKGRTWKEFEYTMSLLVSKLTKKQKVLCWVHNLPYEFSFMKKRYNEHITNVFCKEHDKPIKFDFMNKIEFRDSMQLHNKGLDGLAKDFCKVRKLKRDLDFSIKRSSKDLLTEKEERYTDNDVIILSQFDMFVWDNLVIDDTIPITQTGILRSTIKKYLKDNGQYKRVIQRTKDTFPSKELYNLVMNYLFKGGFCGSMFTIVGEILENLDSWDFESSYPSIMLQPRYRFPVGKFTKNNIQTYEEFKELSKSTCCFAIFRIYNLKPKTNHNFISKHKVFAKSCEKMIVLNGKIRRVVNGYIEVVENEIDMKSYELFYSWDKIEIVSCWNSDGIRRGLPTYITVPLIDALTLKQTKKHNHENYSVEKSKLNSGYGMLVQRLIVQEIDWDSVTGEFTNRPIDDYNKMIKNRMFPIYWGVYITSYARYNLLEGIHAYKDTVYCYDTDSMKGHFDNLNYINEYNRQCKEQNMLIAKKYNVDMSIVETLGCWDCETTDKKYLRFKTLGSKRYIYTNDNVTLHQTVCGLGENALFKHTKNKYKLEKDTEIVDRCFDEFKDGMFIKDANKLYHELQEECNATINGIEMVEYSGTVLTPNKFTMKLEQFYANYIKNYLQSNCKYERRL